MDINEERNDQSIYHYASEKNNDSQNHENSEHYLCPNCLHFPLITFKDKEKIFIKCEEFEEKIEMNLDIYLKTKISKGDIKKFCNPDQNKYSDYCCDCAKNLSENSLKDHKDKGHNIKNFNEMINFIKNKLKLEELEKENTETQLDKKKEKKEINTTITEKNENINAINNIEEYELNEIFSKSCKKLINMIIKDEKLYPNNNHYENIKYFFYCLIDQLEIEYHSYENQSLNIRIFGKNFVENNINNFILLIDGKEEKLKEIVEVQKPNETLKIKLIKINEPTDLSEMFYKCDCLSKIEIINGWNVSNVTSMNGMFYGCKALEKLPDISKWVTNKITDLSSMFEGCAILERIPDISKWDVKKVKSMSCMFSGCESLKSLPDLSKWQTNNLETIDSMFQNCNNLISLEGLHNWDTSQITDMSYAFQNCWSLTDFGDIFNWNTGKVISFSNMFANCKSLTRLPDLSKWNTLNAKKMNYMFSNCTKLESLPDISKWNIENVLYMNNMFENCSSLKQPPEFSKEKNKLLDESFIFKGCDF